MGDLSEKWNEEFLHETASRLSTFRKCACFVTQSLTSVQVFSVSDFKSLKFLAKHLNQKTKDQQERHCTEDSRFQRASPKLLSASTGQQMHC